jgi:hypothetical protein
MVFEQKRMALDAAEKLKNKNKNIFAEEKIPEQTQKKIEEVKVTKTKVEPIKIIFKKEEKRDIPVKV